MQDELSTRQAAIRLRLAGEKVDQICPVFFISIIRGCSTRKFGYMRLGERIHSASDITAPNIPNDPPLTNKFGAFTMYHRSSSTLTG